MNLITPTIKGNHKDLESLKSWTRRLIVLELGSSYTSKDEDVDLEKRVFKEDPTLGTFLSSGDARLIYMKRVMIPFMRTHTAEECAGFLCSPGKEVVDATANYVRKMAAGGQRDMGKGAVDGGEGGTDSAGAEARLMLEAVHKGTPVGDKVKEYRVRRVSKLP
eukprot:6456496-Amphidinium_carterae.1